VTFENHKSGLKYRAGKKAKESQMDMTFGTDDGMLKESEYEARKRDYQRQASKSFQDVTLNEYDPCPSCGNGRRVPMRFWGKNVLRPVVCCPTIENEQ
jgi:hypothetical protein